MFFRMVNDGAYRVKGTVIPQEITDMVPSELTLVYWDYSQPEKSSYDEMFRQHRYFHNPIAFAGGDASWYGLVPLTRLAQNCALAASESLIENKIGEVYVTVWRSDGGPCSWFASLNSLFVYGESCWSEPGTWEERAQSRLKTCTGLEMEDVLAIEDLHKLPGNKLLGRKRGNPSKYMFYQNILQGRFDAHVPKGSGEQFKKAALRLQDAKRNAGEYEYLFETLIRFGEVLEYKAELGREIFEAYQSGNKAVLGQICDETIPKTVERIQQFRNALRRQWYRENKSYGFDSMDVRIGGVMAQMDTARFIIRDYLDGKTEQIEELEAARLPYLPEGMNEETGNVIEVNRWERIAAVNLSNMIGYK